MNYPHATMAARAAEEAGFDPSELCTAHYRLFMAGYDAGLTAAQYEADANAETHTHDPDYHFTDPDHQ